MGRHNSSRRFIMHILTPMFLSMIFHLLLFTDATLTSLRAVCMKTIFLQIAVAWTSAGGRKDVILRLNTSVLFLVPALTRIDEQAKLEFKLNKNKRDIFAVSLLILLVMKYGHRVYPENAEGFFTFCLSIGNEMLMSKAIYPDQDSYIKNELWTLVF